VVYRKELGIHNQESRYLPRIHGTYQDVYNVEMGKAKEEKQVKYLKNSA
jgi:hypothetical protein